MPYAITSDKWVKHHSEQEKKRIEKENIIKKRKLETTLKKTSAETKNNSKKLINGVRENQVKEKQNDVEATKIQDVDDENKKLARQEQNKKLKLAVKEGESEKFIDGVRENKVVKKEIDVETKRPDKTSSKTFNIGDFMVISYQKKRYPGLIKNIDQGAQEYEISVMEKIKPNFWRWPKNVDQIWYKRKFVLEKISEPISSKGSIYNLNI
ncbi:uncharacterized protein LOC126733688 [Anthonomus grandis grandis]|uniref:uncharacterized protein LOC126733688 n=1 Tax=Anthonomus grandis grandis TaxID=2921223 RepID=UPI0021664F98|nr:uncharacterized protein LOC126733688 [Anthonomus grandis grandis]